jgi:hypothetical protein
MSGPAKLVGIIGLNGRALRQQAHKGNVETCEAGRDQPSAGGRRAVAAGRPPVWTAKAGSRLQAEREEARAVDGNQGDSPLLLTALQGRDLFHLGTNPTHPHSIYQTGATALRLVRLHAGGWWQ